MRLGSYTVALLTSLVVIGSIGSIGCGGKHQEAKVAESDPWAGYKGTYAPGAPDPTPSADDKAKSSTAVADTKPDARPGKKPKGKRGKKGAAADDATAAAADPPAAAAPPDKPVSANATSPSALYGDGTSTATTTSAGDDTAAAPAPKKPKKKAAKKKKPAAPAQ